MELRWKSEWTVPSVVGVVSFGVGIGVGYAIRAYRDNRLVRSFDEIMEEVERNEPLQSDLNQNGHDPEILELVDIEEEEHEWSPTDLLIDRSQHPSVSRSIFPNPLDEDGWDYEEEMKNRDPENPYIIHRDEYEDNEKEFSQSTLTYYRGDNVLCDENDMPIYNAERIAAPLTFGKGSQDPSIVYICNEKLEALYEVILDTGYFQVEVLGEEIENSFENKKQPLPKFRPE